MEHQQGAFFNPQDEINIYENHRLPHWQQDSVWYFLTFRLADSLPAGVAEEIKIRREWWKKTHNLDKLTEAEQTEYRKLFSERYEKLLDAGHGSCVLRDAANAKIIADALRFFDGQRYILDEFVVMPNHVHVLVKPLRGHRIEDILHSWKSYTANEINRRENRAGQLWMRESYDHLVRHERAQEAIRQYIWHNRAPSALHGQGNGGILPPLARA